MDSASLITIMCGAGSVMTLTVIVQAFYRMDTKAQNKMKLDDVQIMEHDALEPRTLMEWNHTRDCTMCYPRNAYGYPIDYFKPDEIVWTTRTVFHKGSSKIVPVLPDPSRKEYM